MFRLRLCSFPLAFLLLAAFSASCAAQTQDAPPLKDYVIIQVRGYSEPLATALKTRLAVFEGRPFHAGLRAEILRAAREIDPAARIPVMTQRETPEGALETHYVVAAFGATAPPNEPASAFPQPDSIIEFNLEPLPEALRTPMSTQLSRFAGRIYSAGLFDEIRRTVVETNPDCGITGIRRQQMRDRSVVTFTIGSALAAQRAAAVPGIMAVPVESAEQAARLVRHVPPVYPALARQARIQGVVRINALIGKDGRVARLTLVSGHPLLAEAAQTAVKQWIYQPTLVNGEPVEVTTAIEVPFTLP